MLMSYIMSPIPSLRKKMSICLFLFLKQRKRLVVLYNLYCTDTTVNSLHLRRTRVNSRVLDAQSSVFGVLFYRSLFVIFIVFVFWALYCPSYLDMLNSVVIFRVRYVHIILHWIYFSSQITLT